MAALVLTVGLSLVVGSFLSRSGVEPPGTIIAEADSAWRDEEELNILLFPAPVASSPEVWEELLPELEAQAAESPGDALASRRLALAYYNLGYYEDARAVYEVLLAVEDTALIRNRLGNVLRDSGDLKGAEEAYRQAVQIDPAFPAPYVNLAELLWRSRRDQEAVAILEQGLGEVPAEAREHLERSLDAMGRAE